MTRVIVCGSRNYTDHEWVWKVLDELVEDDDVIIHGDCPSGADKFASEWCISNGVTQIRYPAQWKQYKRRAGPIRNQQMVDAGADMCIGFPMLGSRGSWDCMTKAEEAGIPVYNMGEKYGTE